MRQKQLPDLLSENLDIVFCGSAAGKHSAEVKAYYAKGTNRFYKTLFETGLTDIQVKPENYADLLNYRIGLTDLNQTEAGMDHQLTPEKYDVAAFRVKMLRFRPKIIAFTSKNAGMAFYGTKSIEFGEQPALLNGSKIFVLPSTSGMNGTWAKTQHHWHHLKAALV